MGRKVANGEPAGSSPLGSTLKERASAPRPKNIDVGLAETLRSPEDPSLAAKNKTPELSSADLAPGTVIEGGYRIVAPIGSGAMGIVMCAHDERLDRRVAIKFVRPALLSGSFRARFAAEARAMARVSHPNVLTIYASGEHAGAPFFVMEFVDGRTLEDWLDRESRMPPDLDLALPILEQICQGVSAIHAAETVHRDIKPSNILLDARLHPRIADLGLAVLNRTAHGPAPGEVVGTPAYMAPESASPRDVEPSLRPRADVYSLACVGYELITGRRPFDAASSAELMELHARSPVPPPSSIRPDAAPFDDAILQAMAKDPAERTATAEAFRRAIVAAREGSPEPVRILIAEDDGDYRELLRGAFLREFPDAHVECVGDGREALAAFDQAAPSVAIVDLQLPTIDGLELTGLLRSREAAKSMPIIVLTGAGGPGEWKRLAALGADRFFVKPVVLEDVVAAVRRALRERSGGPRSIGS